jgi:hypothetical protein
MRETLTVTRAKEDKPEGRERRRKTGLGELTGRRLGVLKSALDFNQFKYRWLNDNEARILAKTKEDDWDFVTKDGGVKDDSADFGNVVSQIVGSKPDGSALYAYLCRKPKSWWEEDQAAKQADLDEQLAQLRRGNDRAGGSQGDYVPASGIKIQRG